jgi:hypothetical protein
MYTVQHMVHSSVSTEPLAVQRRYFYTFKDPRNRLPGIDSKESTPRNQFRQPMYVALRAGTTTLFLLGS